MHFTRWKCISVLAAASLRASSVRAAPAVNVDLQAAFNAPPYLLELLETAAAENSSSYFPLLDRIADGYFKSETTDEKLYNSFLKLLQDDGHIKDAESLSSFRLALSIHSAAPRIEAHYQFYNTSVEPSIQSTRVADCDVWFELSGKQYCFPDIAPEQAIFGKTRTEELPFDRIYGNTFDPTATIIYADVTSPSFGQLLRIVKDTISKGQGSFRVRYKPSVGSPKKPLVVNGYGVQLTLKRTDYIVIDDRQAEEQSKSAAKQEPLASSFEDEEVADLKPLSNSELSKLGIRAANFVLDSDKPFDTLIRLTQDFPKHSKSIANYNISESYLKEYDLNRVTVLPPGYNTMWINGVRLEDRDVDAFSLLEHLRRERKLINGITGIKDLGLSSKDAISLLSYPAIAEAQSDAEPQRYDFRDQQEGGGVILWLNDIEKDKRYATWPQELMTLLQRMYPGQLPQIRRNMNNLIVPIDFADSKDVGLLVETLQMLVKRAVAVRIGLVPVVTGPASAAQAKAAYHLSETYGLSYFMAYFENAVTSRKLEKPEAKSFDSLVSGARVRKDQTALAFTDVTGTEQVYQGTIERARQYLVRLGLDSVRPPTLVNGVPIALDDDWLQNMSNRLGMDIQIIQRGLYEGVFDEDTDVLDIFLAGAALKRNPLVIPPNAKEIQVLDLSNIYATHNEIIRKLPLMPVEGTEQQTMGQLFVVSDFDDVQGRSNLREAVKFYQAHKEVEIIFVHNPSTQTKNRNVSARLYAIAEGNQSKVAASLIELVESPILQQDTDTPSDLLESSRDFWAQAQPLVQAFGLGQGESGYILNGRLVGPLPPSRSFQVEDFENLLDYEGAKRIAPVIAATKDLPLWHKPDSAASLAQLSALVARSTISDIPEGLFETTSSQRYSIWGNLSTEHTTIQTGNENSATIQITVSIDPASEVAQRWVPILKVISEMDGVYMSVYLNPQNRLTELPVKRFYRQVLQVAPSFDSAGALQSQGAKFTGIPADALLTTALDVPSAWVVSAKNCVEDLDNIKLSSIKGKSEIQATYELEYVLIEGHSRDMSTGGPPRGTQLILGTQRDPHFADTIVMANLGYFQFKANPGFYNIQLKQGRSNDIFHIDSIGSKGYAPQSGDETTELALMSFQGATLFPRLSRKPGKEDDDVLEAPVAAAPDVVGKTGQWVDNMLAKAGVKNPKTSELIAKGVAFGSKLFSGQKAVANKTSTAHADINIFSVASGHLYERMLNIMMVSVMKHTNHTVKFWFIEQFLSPSFKSFLPTLAAEYGFDYEMVTYKWPHWLRGQKEKQREIWGYKILFLDVLFPLDLDKVIFVDADQIVRTDMYELVTLDLKGAPYGFTPMCDSRTEMEGFRFWKQGYWKTYLRGLPYHISALYVVDLNVFRRIAAGDRLRQQYQQLSADPNSLSNLDQDLPNHMQMALPIHSLPQEWLWCETWCSDESLKDAKTIDLCNNPQTKEPKLDRARRQVPEWTAYDEEIAALARRSKDGKDSQQEQAPIAEQNEATAGQKIDEAAAEGRPRDEL